MGDRHQAFRALFAPRSVAVVGASTRPESVGRAVFANILLHGYTGVVYPVNPKAASILAVKAYASVLEIPDELDLAVIVVPSASIPQVVEECGWKGTKGAGVISAGFKELGVEGAKREEIVLQAARRLGIRLIGPNCLGVINCDPHGARGTPTPPHPPPRAARTPGPPPPPPQHANPPLPPKGGGGGAAAGGRGGGEAGVQRDLG